jgi:hypothetical protein
MSRQEAALMQSMRPLTVQALELTRQQEITKQAEHKEKEAQAMAHAAQLNKV